MRHSNQSSVPKPETAQNTSTTAPLSGWEEVRNRRQAKEIATQQERIKVRHDGIHETFRSHREAWKEWDQECSMKHQEELARYNARREEEERRIQEHFVQKQQKRVDEAKAKERAHTLQELDGMESTLRRLGRDGSSVDQQPSTGAKTPQKEAPTEKALAEEKRSFNDGLISEIRQRKEEDIRARKDKIQRHFRMESEQSRLGTQMLLKKKEEDLLERARKLATEQRQNAVERMVKRISKEVSKEMNAVHEDVAQKILKTREQEHDTQFAVKAAADRVVTVEDFHKVREPQKQKEEVKKDNKHKGIEGHCKILAEQLVSLTCAVVEQNTEHLGDGNTIYRSQQLGVSSWRVLMDKYMSAEAVEAAKQRAARVANQKHQRKRFSFSGSLSGGSLSQSRLLSNATSTMPASPLGELGAITKTETTIFEAPGAVEQGTGPRKASTGGEIPTLQSIDEDEIFDQVEHFLATTATYDASKAVNFVESAVSYFNQVAHLPHSADALHEDAEGDEREEFTHPAAIAILGHELTGAAWLLHSDLLEANESLTPETLLHQHHAPKVLPKTPATPADTTKKGGAKAQQAAPKQAAQGKPAKSGGTGSKDGSRAQTPINDETEPAQSLAQMLATKIFLHYQSLEAAKTQRRERLFQRQDLERRKEAIRQAQIEYEAQQEALRQRFGKYYAQSRSPGRGGQGGAGGVTPRAGEMSSEQQDQWAQETQKLAEEEKEAYATELPDVPHSLILVNFQWDAKLMEELSAELWKLSGSGDSCPEFVVGKMFGAVFLTNSLPALHQRRREAKVNLVNASSEKHAPLSEKETVSDLVSVGGTSESANEKLENANAVKRKMTPLTHPHLTPAPPMKVQPEPVENLAPPPQGGGRSHSIAPPSVARALSISAEANTALQTQQQLHVDANGPMKNAQGVPILTPITVTSAISPEELYQEIHSLHNFTSYLQRSFEKAFPFSSSLAVNVDCPTMEAYAVIPKKVTDTYLQLHYMSLFEMKVAASQKQTLGLQSSTSTSSNPGRNFFISKLSIIFHSIRENEVRNCAAFRRCLQRMVAYFTNESYKDWKPELEQQEAWHYCDAQRTQDVQVLGAITTEMVQATTSCAGASMLLCLQLLLELAQHLIQAHQEKFVNQTYLIAEIQLPSMEEMTDVLRREANKPQNPCTTDIFLHYLTVLSDQVHRAISKLEPKEPSHIGGSNFTTGGEMNEKPTDMSATDPPPQVPPTLSNSMNRTNTISNSFDTALKTIQALHQIWDTIAVDFHQWLGQLYFASADQLSELIARCANDWSFILFRYFSNESSSSGNRGSDVQEKAIRPRTVSQFLSVDRSVPHHNYPTTCICTSFHLQHFLRHIDCAMMKSSVETSSSAEGDQGHLLWLDKEQFVHAFLGAQVSTLGLYLMPLTDTSDSEEDDGLEGMDDPTGLDSHVATFGELTMTNNSRAGTVDAPLLPPGTADANAAQLASSKILAIQEKAKRMQYKRLIPKLPVVEKDSRDFRELAMYIPSWWFELGLDDRQLQEHPERQQALHKKHLVPLRAATDLLYSFDSFSKACRRDEVGKMGAEEAVSIPSSLQHTGGPVISLKRYLTQLLLGRVQQGASFKTGSIIPAKVSNPQQLSFPRIVSPPLSIMKAFGLQCCEFALRGNSSVHGHIAHMQDFLGLPWWFESGFDSWLKDHFAAGPCNSPQEVEDATVQLVHNLWCLWSHQNDQAQQNKDTKSMTKARVGGVPIRLLLRWISSDTTSIRSLEKCYAFVAAPSVHGSAVGGSGMPVNAVAQQLMVASPPPKGEEGKTTAVLPQSIQRNSQPGLQQPSGEASKASAAAKSAMSQSANSVAIDGESLCAIFPAAFTHGDLMILKQEKERLSGGGTQKNGEDEDAKMEVTLATISSSHWAKTLLKHGDYIGDVDVEMIDVL